jgi:hypothetical protein
MPSVQRLKDTMKQHVSGTETTGHDEAMHFRYWHQHSLLGTMDFRQVLPPEILFPDENLFIE